MNGRIAATLLAGAFAAAAPLGAQSGIGIVGGYVSANVSVDPSSSTVSTSARSGFAAGLSLGTKVGDGASLAIQGLYAQKGATGNVFAVSGSAELDYIEVPLLLRVGFGSGNGMRIFLTGGGQYSFLMTCTTKVTGLADNDCKQNSTPNSGVKSSDYGVVFGAGVSSGRISVSVRYDMGLANLNNDTSTGATTVKNRAIMALVGITMGK